MALPDDPASPLGADSRLYRHDLATGERQVHDFGEGRYPGEFVFVPKAAGSEEAQGWLMGLVVDLAAERTDLVILDAERFEARPQALVHLPYRVPAGFHGNWIANGELAAGA
jgi:carotenoid cleavage dioxygenase